MTWGEFAVLGSRGGGAKRWRAAAVWATALAVGALTVGLFWLADRQGQATHSPAPTPSVPSLGVVSLSPAITQWITALGQAHTLVAVGDGDVMAPRGTPSVGTFVDVDLERLAGLKPSVVLAATAPEKLPRALRDAAGRGGFRVEAWDYPTTLEAAMAFGPHVGGALGNPEGGAALAHTLGARLDAVAGAVAGRPRVRTLLLFSVEPLQACGAGTVHDTLLSVAGGVNVLAASAGSAPTLDRELLRGLAPDVILLMRPGAAPLSGRNDPRLAALGGQGLPAVDQGKVVLLNDPAVLLPGPTVDHTAVSFAVALHPQRALAVAQAYAAVGDLPVDAQEAERP